MNGRLALALVLSFLALDAFAALELPAVVMVEAEGPNGAPAFWTARVANVPEDDRGRQTPTIICSPASGTLFPLGTTRVSCAGSEGSTGGFDVIVRDTTGPALKLPPHLEAAPAPGQNGAAVTYNASARDLVDGPVPVQCSPPPGAFFPLGNTTVNCSAADARGNATRGTFVVTVFAQPPQPGQGPRDLIVEATSPTGARVVYDMGDPDGEGGRPAPSGCSPAPGSVFPLGNTKVTCDVGGGFWVVVRDTRPPVIDTPGSLSATTSDPAGAILSYVVTARDVVDGPVMPSCNPGSGALFAVGTTVITCNAGDSRGNSSQETFTAQVTLLNSNPPVLTLPGDLSAEATSAAGATVTFDAAAGDDTDGNVAVSCSPASGSLFAIDTTVVTCSATDSDGNTTAGTFTVTVVDTTAPDLTLPGDLSAEATGPDGATVSFVASATDVVDGPVTTECTARPGLFPIGTTSVVCVAGDSRGNAASGSFAVIVSDTTPPVLAVPADITAEATSPAGAPVSFTATAADIVDGPVTVTCTPPSGSTFGFGTTNAVCSATDAHGNGASRGFTVTVADTTAPDFVSASASPDVLWPPNGRLHGVTVSVSVTDAGDAAPAVRIFNVTANEPTGAGDRMVTGPLTVQLRAARLGSGRGRVYTIHLEAVDDSGNRATSSVTVLVPHDMR